MSNYRLRPHHGLCLHYFRGEGYSEEFIKNMQSIVDELHTNPTILLVPGADSVCRTCPNRIGDIDCACDEKVLRYDQKVLELCGLTISSTLTWDELEKKVHQHILSQNLRESICGDCSWNQLCTDT